MNTPSAALIWELWRKNRWGFVVLGLLFVVCAALTSVAIRSEKKASWLESHNPNLVVLSAEQMLGSSATGLVTEKFQLKLNATTIYDGVVLPGDRFQVEVDFSGHPELRMVLRNARGRLAPSLAEGPEGTDPAAKQDANATNQRWTFRQRLKANPSLSWVAADGRKGDVPLAFNPGYAEEVLLARVRAEQWREEVLAWSIVAFTFSLLVIFAIFGAAEPNSARGFTGIPPRRFTLPVRTGVLIGWPLGLGALVLAGIYLGWSHWVLHPLTAARGPLPDLYLVLVLCAGLASFQALVWALPSFPKTRACLLTFAVLCVLLLAAIPFEAAANRQAELLLVLLCAVIWVGAMGFAWLGVKLERRGFWTGWTLFKGGVARLDVMIPRTVGFLSPLHAQCWMEWRRNGRLALGVLVFSLLVVLVCALAIQFGAEPAQSAAGVLLVVLVPATLAWVGITGLNFARDGSSKRLAISSFMAVRPVRSGVLVQAKLLAAGAVWVLGAAAFSFVWWLLVLLQPNGPSLDSSIWLFAWCALLALSLHLFTGILPLCLSGRMAGFPWSFLPWLIAYGALGNIAIWFGEHPNRLPLVFWLCSLALLLKLVTAFWGFGNALRARLVSLGFVLGYGLFWLATTAVMMRLASAQADRMGWSDESMALMAGATLVIPLARIGLSPMALALNRHR